MILLAILTVWCSLFLSPVVRLPNHVIIEKAKATSHRVMKSSCAWACCQLAVLLSLEVSLTIIEGTQICITLYLFNELTLKANSSHFLN